MSPQVSPQVSPQTQFQAFEHRSNSVVQVFKRMVRSGIKKGGNRTSATPSYEIFTRTFYGCVLALLRASDKVRHNNHRPARYLRVSVL